ncbi:MAG: hypothetical protein CW742_00035 [Methanoregula sp.]|nr:MAG: hypothetical protein CW742_00035 [Methanoregula sp.]
MTGADALMPQLRYIPPMSTAYAFEELRSSHSSSMATFEVLQVILDYVTITSAKGESKISRFHGLRLFPQWINDEKERMKSDIVFGNLPPFLSLHVAVDNWDGGF